MLLIVGGTQLAVPLVRLANMLGFRTVVTDARPAYATREKHPEADLLLPGWPGDVLPELGIDERTYVVSLNHEPRFEDALWRALAGHPVAYIGAIGKPQRKQEREERLAVAGFDLGQFPPIHTPVGLDIGGSSDAERALSVMAEVIAVRHGRSGGMLVQRNGHHPST
jgi:xanthine dehydrogenase accessory factor